MKYGLLLIGIIVIGLMGFLGTAFATHDPTYNHPTPIAPPELELPPCTSTRTRDACHNPPICENSLWDVQTDRIFFQAPLNLNIWVAVPLT